MFNEHCVNWPKTSPLKNSQVIYKIVIIISLKVLISRHQLCLVRLIKAWIVATNSVITKY